MNKDINILIGDQDIKGIEEVSRFLHTKYVNVMLASDYAAVLDHLLAYQPYLTLLSLKIAHTEQWKLLKYFHKTRIPVIALVDQQYAHLMEEGGRQGISAYMVKPLDYLHMNIYFHAIISQICPCCSSNPSVSGRQNCFDRRFGPVDGRWNDFMIQSNNIVSIDDRLHIGHFTINETDKSAYIDGNKLELSPKEYSLLNFLVRNQGKVLTAEDILSSVWLGSERASKEDVKQYIYMLRKKIENKPSEPHWLQTRKGFGYQLSCY